MNKDPDMNRLDEPIDASLDNTLDAESLIELAALVQRDTSTRTRFSTAMHAAREIDRGLDALMNITQRTNLPTHRTQARSNAPRIHTIVLRLSQAAAVLLLTATAWIVSGRLAQSPQINPAPTEGMSASAALIAYMQAGVAEGRVVRELAPVTVEVHPTSAGMEVVYIRSILERALVEDIYRVSRDEHGRFVAIREDAPTSSGQSL